MNWLTIVAPSDFFANHEQKISPMLEKAYEAGRLRAHSCSEESCTHPPSDYARLTLSAPAGNMQVEVLLCELHLATLEMATSGKYLLLRKARS